MSKSHGVRWSTKIKEQNKRLDFGPVGARPSLLKLMNEQEISFEDISSVPEVETVKFSS